MNSYSAALTLLGLVAVIWWLCEQSLGQDTPANARALQLQPKVEGGIQSIDIVVPGGAAIGPELASMAGDAHRYLNAAGFDARLRDEPSPEKSAVTFLLAHGACEIVAGEGSTQPCENCGPRRLTCDTDGIAQMGCAAFLAAVNRRNAASPAVAQILASLTSALQLDPDSSDGLPNLDAYCRAHLALCRGDQASLDDAYDALKTQPQTHLAPWTATALRQEILLSLASAERHGRPAAAWRGLEALRRLDEIDGADNRFAACGPRLRRVLAGQQHTWVNGDARDADHPRN